MKIYSTGFILCLLTCLLLPCHAKNSTKASAASLMQNSQNIVQALKKNKIQKAANLIKESEKMIPELTDDHETSSALGYFYRVMSEYEAAYKGDYSSGEELYRKAFKYDRKNGIEAAYCLCNVILHKDEPEQKELSIALEAIDFAFSNDEEKKYISGIDYLNYFYLHDLMDKPKEALEEAENFLQNRNTPYFVNGGFVLSKIFEKNERLPEQILCLFLQQEYLYCYTGYRTKAFIDLIDKKVAEEKGTSTARKVVDMIKAFYSGEKFDTSKLPESLRSTWIIEYIEGLSTIRMKDTESINAGAEKLNGIAFTKTYPVVPALLYLYHRPENLSDSELSKYRQNLLEWIHTIDNPEITGETRNIYERMLSVVKAPELWAANAMNLFMVVPNHLKP